MEREIKYKICVYILIGVIFVEIYPIQKDYFEKTRENPDVLRYEGPVQAREFYISGLDTTATTTAVWSENFIN